MFQCCALSTCVSSTTVTGSLSDGGVWASTDLSNSLDSEEMGLPPPKELPFTSIKINHAFVADEAFPLGVHIMRPYSRQNLDDDKRIFNYRLSRARRTIENAFGIMAARWQIFLKGINFHPDRVDDIVKALVCLHNFILDGENRLPRDVARGGEWVNFHPPSVLGKY